jgi:lysophospholipase L1-like esterase
VGFLQSRLVRHFRPGIAETLDDRAPYRESWLAENRRTLASDGPLWVVLGDSTGQGLGASAYDRGYVGQLRSLLTARDGHPWRVLNASVSGARVRGVLSEQLAWLDACASPPDLVTCAVGANDLLRPGSGRLLRDMSTLLDRLPAGAAVATLPKGLGPRRAVRVNALIRERAPRNGLLVADVWEHTGPPWHGKHGIDNFHPNEVGYRDWTAAFAEAIGLAGTTSPDTIGSV